jgi:hypothetical protein
MSAKQPTVRQKRVVEILVENDGKAKPRSIGGILKEVGYSDAIVKTPSKVTGAAGFQLALVQAGIDDARLIRVIEEGLQADRPWGKDGDIHPDYGVRHKYLETSLRLKGLVKADETNNTYNTFVQQNNINPNSIDSKELVGNMVDYLMEQTRAK